MLDEVTRTETASINESEKAGLLDMKKAKQTMQGMNNEQQSLVEQLLSKLKIEQIMRLQSEEQHD